MTSTPSDHFDQHESRLDRIERALENFSTAIALDRGERLQDISPISRTVAEAIAALKSRSSRRSRIAL